MSFIFHLKVLTVKGRTVHMELKKNNDFLALRVTDFHTNMKPLGQTEENKWTKKVKVIVLLVSWRQTFNGDLSTLHLKTHCLQSH